MHTPEQILDLLHTWFHLVGANTQAQVDDQGLVNLPQASVQLLRPPPQGRLPVQFGHVQGFSCSNMGLVTLAGAPHTVDHAFMCRGNQLITLVGAPKTCTTFSIRDNPLQDLNGFPDKVNLDVSVTYQPHLPLLQLFKAKQVLMYSGRDAPDVPKVVSEVFQDRPHTDPRTAAMMAAVKLIKAGLKDNARW